MSFDNLLDDLEALEGDDTLVKGMSSTNNGDTLNLNDDDDDFMKSFDLNGEPVQAIDADDLMKSLTTLVDDRLGEFEQPLMKAIGIQTAVLQRQNKAITTLQNTVALLKSELAAFGGKGAGAMSVRTINPETELKKSEQFTKEDLLAKANSLWENGKMSGTELRNIDTALRGNGQLNPQLVSKILNTAGV